ncbi:hypothetical protein I4U23_011630 [Adineta vaga]|nr:hypothetical protein I4U23_011630 [Adineta vaga]
MEKGVFDDPNPIYLYSDGEITQFEEVAGTCSNKDNFDEDCCTIRSISIGTIFVVGISYLHQWTKYTYSNTYISPILSIILSYPFGHLWTWIVPNSTKFTQKEHGLILIMTNIAWMYFTVFNYATSATIPLLEYDNRNFVHYFFLVVALQFIGFGLAGIMRRFLVWPTEIIWPQNLPLIAILRTLHENQLPAIHFYNNNKTIQKLKKYFFENKLKFFILITIVTFIYEWFPLYILSVLSVFSWMCLFKRNNYLLAQLTSVRGLALGAGGLTLDWSQITMYLGSPLIVPRWAIINITFGFVLIIWFIVPIVYGSNVRNINDNPIGGIMFPGLTSMSLVTAFTSFACLPAVFVHMILYHSIDLWNQLRTKNLNNMGNDMHARLMSLYKKVPDWWYLILFCISLIIICVLCDYNKWLKWYLVLLSLAINACLVLPFGLLSSITGQFLHNAPVYYLGVIIAQGLSLGQESRESYTYLTVGYVLFVQTLSLIQDMKLGHYLKIGHRSLFFAQCLSSLICSSVSIGIQYMYYKEYGLNNEFDSSFSIFDYTLLGGSIFTDKNGFFSDVNSENRKLLWGFLVGAFLPILTWFLAQWPRFYWLKHFHWPLILITISWMPSLLSAGALCTWILIGLTVCLTIGKYSFLQRHIYLTSAALDLGLNLTQIIISNAFINTERLFPTWKGTQNNNGYDSCKLALTTKK